jgi:hypothetical protein
MAPIARQISQAEKHLGGRFCFTTSRRADLHGRQGGCCRVQKQKCSCVMRGYAGATAASSTAIDGLTRESKPMSYKRS